MNPLWGTPPASLDLISKSPQIVERLSPLVGSAFNDKVANRTKGSNLRKLIASQLEEFPLPRAADEYTVVVDKGKGVPKLLRELIDTYIHTGARSYNLQVWNRIPDSDEPIVIYEDGTSLANSDVRYIVVRVVDGSIRSIVVLSPIYITTHFGPFGRPTIKHQLIITSTQRKRILSLPNSSLVLPDTISSQPLLSNVDTNDQRKQFNRFPGPDDKILPVEMIAKLVDPLIGMAIAVGKPKMRGQLLERTILHMLGYSVGESDSLEGQYPDIRNQLLEIKIQDSPTVDLGRYTPEREIVVIPEFELTTFDIRYLIVLMNSGTGFVEGVLICPGVRLGDYFSYVIGVNGKSQRSIPKSFFDKIEGTCSHNPTISYE